MFAVIKTGGKQYRVSQGDKLRVESLDADEGESVNLDQVLMVGDRRQMGHRQNFTELEITGISG